MKGTFEVGDGSTQGSCSSRIHRCHPNGKCAECISDSNCNGLSDTCENSKCVCGKGGTTPCNGTVSNHCVNGECMCGSFGMCGRNVLSDIEETYGNLVTDCSPDKCLSFKYNADNSKLIPDISSTNTDKRYCGCYWDGTKCRIQRSDQEVCQRITKYYNPLFIKDKLSYNDGSLNVLECDDVIGGRVGEYHCLGNEIFL